MTKAVETCICSYIYMFLSNEQQKRYICAESWMYSTYATIYINNYTDHMFQKKIKVSLLVCIRICFFLRPCIRICLMHIFV
jgi:hypothetical protein